MSFWETFQTLCEQKGVSLSKACEQIGVASSILVRWRNGSIPRVSTLERMSKYFGLSKEAILGYEDIPAPTDDDYPGEVRKLNEFSMLFGLMSGMTSEEMNELCKYAQFILSQR